VSDEPAPIPLAIKRTRKAVAHLADQGFRVLRVHPNDKRPVDAGWPEKATDHPGVLDDWFNAPFNVGVACGPQPNRLNLVVIDVDTKHDGMDTWRSLVEEYSVANTATHITPSGGLHVFFDAPIELTNSRLAPGIDVRGVGGQVVVPPSGRFIDDVYVEYREQAPGYALGVHPVAPMPQWLVNMLVKPVIERAIERHPSQPSTSDRGLPTNADWFSAQFDFLADLDRQGYTIVGQHGDEIYLRHPTATSEKSATFHADDNFMYAYSTNMPSALRTKQIGRDGNTGWSGYDWWVATTWNGDYSAATSEVNRMRSGAVAERAAAATAPTEGDATPLNLPSEFWAARPVLTRIRQAAWAAGCSPDALLIQTLARVATYVPPCFKLPGVEQGLIGKHQTLDFLGCVVAETSGGKTMAAGIGERFVPAPEPPTDGSDPLIDFEQQVGSGEGIAEFFLVPEMYEDEDGKLRPTGRRIVGRQALFINVDEGTGFTQQAGRKGTTIIATLASAWSGEALGQLNAASETRRLVRGGRVRICAVINMQDTNGYKLFTDDLSSVGFTGRLLFASAHDPGAPAPAEQPSWPGPLGWTPPPGGLHGPNRYLTYDPAITAEIKQTRWGILTKQVQIDHLQSQYLLLRCKVAALLAILDDRFHVSNDDWLLATEIITMSAACLEHLSAIHSDQVEVTAVTAQEFRLKVVSTAEERHLQRLVPGWQAKILARLRKGPQPWKGLKDVVESPRRDDLRRVIGDMVAEGLIEQDGSRYQIRR